MSWPLSQDYNEAIQDPRGSFADAELKSGEAVTNALGIPMPRSGNFADVYEVRCPSGARWAVKCFTREVHGLRERYHEISKYLHQANLPFMVDFHYLEQGIRIRGQWYPVLKMRWVEGFVLNEFVRENLDKKPILQALGQIWLRMARRLRETNIAHCDLQHGNVMFVPGSTANSLAVKLIDYDGMCVPALAGQKSGEVGHPAYQHPERLRTGAYNSETDRFSLLHIAAALRCLTVGGRSLWERYDTGDNLLFRQADLQEPKESPLFRELLAIRDAPAQALVKELYRACQGPLATVPLVTELIAEEKSASKGTKTVAAEAVGPDWDFGEGESGGIIVAKRRTAGKIPGWVWGVVVGAAMLLVAIGVGAGLALRGGPADKQEASLAQTKPEPRPVKQTPVPPKPDEENPPPENKGADAGKGASEPQPVTPVANGGNEPPAREARNDPVGKSSGGWGRMIDPDGDCQFSEGGGKLTITLPDRKFHDLSVENRRMNAPRLLHDIEGDFTIQVRVAGDFSGNGIEAAGLLLMDGEQTYIRLERGRFGTQSVYFWEQRQDGRKTAGSIILPISQSEGYVRLERRGDKILGSHSTDGANWTELKPFESSLPPKVQIGVAAISTGSAFAPTFDQLRLRQGQDEWLAIDKWLTPGKITVVQMPTPKPPLPKPPPKPSFPPLQRRQRKPVPDAADIAVAIKDIRDRHKSQYSGANRNQLRSDLFNEMNSARNDPVKHFALLREILDIAAESNLRGGISQAQFMAQDFDVDILEMKCIAAEVAFKANRPASEIVEVGMPLLDESVGEEKYGLISRLMKPLQLSAANARLDAARRADAGRALAQAESVRKEHDKLQAELRTLADKPDDPRANLMVGRFHCVTRGDWEGGLPLLARGSDAALKALAEKDLANPAEPEAQTALGEAWRKQAGLANTKSLRAACQKRAYSWYHQAAAQLPAGTKRKSAQQAMAALAKVQPELQNAWWPFSYYSGVSLDPASGFLRIQAPCSIQSRQCYRGPVDVTVVARSMKTDLNISIGNGGRLVVAQNFNGTGDHLLVCRPDSVPEWMGSRAIEKAVTLPPNSTFTVRWQVRPDGMKVWFGDEIVFEETRGFDLNAKLPVRIHCGAAPIELKSVVVRRGPGK